MEIKPHLHVLNSFMVIIHYLVVTIFMHNSYMLACYSICKYKPHIKYNTFSPTESENDLSITFKSLNFLGKV